MANILGASKEELERFLSMTEVQPIKGHWHTRLPNLEGMTYGMMSQFRAPLDDLDPEDPLCVIWKAMLSMLQTCQHIVSNAELAIRTEAAQIDLNTLPSPLEAHTTVPFEQHVRPWLEVMAIICRGECASEYEIDSNMVYWLLNPRQSRLFRKLWDLAEEPQSPDLFGAKRAARKARFEFSPLESACLAFCLSLLNQRPRNDMDECAMISALAVLGWGRNGWEAPEDYMVTLSRLIQTARWMVVARSLELANDREPFVQKWCTGTHMVWMIMPPLQDDEFNGGPSPALESFYRRGGEPTKGRCFLEWVEVITQAFMMRKTLGPMQWMLQLWMDSSRVARTLHVDGPAEKSEQLRDSDIDLPDSPH